MIHILLHEFLYFVSGILKRPCVLLDDTYIAAVCLNEFFYFDSGVLKRPCVLLDDTYIAAVDVYLDWYHSVVLFHQQRTRLTYLFLLSSVCIICIICVIYIIYIICITKDVYLDWYHSAVLLHQQRTWLTYFFFLSSDPLMHNHLLLSVLFALFKHYLHTSIIGIFYMINLADVLLLSSDGLMHKQSSSIIYIHQPEVLITYWGDDNVLLRKAKTIEILVLNWKSDNHRDVDCNF